MDHRRKIGQSRGSDHLELISWLHFSGSNIGCGLNFMQPPFLGLSKSHVLFLTDGLHASHETGYDCFSHKHSVETNQRSPEAVTTFSLVALDLDPVVSSHLLRGF